MSTLIHPKTITVDGLSIRYAEGGQDGPDAILMSPWPESVYAFEPAWSHRHRLNWEDQMVNAQNPRCLMSAIGTKRTFAAAASRSRKLVKEPDKWRQWGSAARYD